MKHLKLNAINQNDNFVFTSNNTSSVYNNNNSTKHHQREKKNKKKLINLALTKVLR